MQRDEGLSSTFFDPRSGAALTHRIWWLVCQIFVVAIMLGLLFARWPAYRPQWAKTLETWNIGTAALSGISVALIVLSWHLLSRFHIAKDALNRTEPSAPMRRLPEDALGKYAGWARQCDDLAKAFFLCGFFVGVIGFVVSFAVILYFILI